MTLSQKVKELRMSAGTSQEELADATRLSLRTIQRIENGETQPRGDSLKRLARALGVATEEFTRDLASEVTGSKILNFQITWFLAFALIYGYVFVCRLNHIAVLMDQATLILILIGLYLFNVISIIVNIIRLRKGKTIIYQPAIPFMPIDRGLL